MSTTDQDKNLIKVTDKLRLEAVFHELTPADIEERLEELATKIKAFKDYEEAPQPPNSRVNPLRVETFKGLFTEEEEQVIGQLDNLQMDATLLWSDTLEKVHSLKRATEESLKYYDRIAVDGEASLDDLRKTAEGQRREASDLYKAVMYFVFRVQSIGWYRHFNQLKPLQVVNEIEALVNSLKVSDDINFLRTTEADYYTATEDALRETFGGAITLVSEAKDNDYSLIKSSHTIPTYDLTEDKREAFIREYVEGLCSWHLQALSYKKHPQGEALKIINETTERLLIEVKKATAINEIEHIKRYPVTKYNYSNTLLSQKLWSGELKKGEQEQLTIWSYVEKTTSEKKEVNSYVTVSYKDLEGLTGVEDLTPEEEDIFNAIVSEIKAGNYYFTNGMIHKTRNGGIDINLTPQQNEEYTRFIESCNMTRITIDNREYAKKTGNNVFYKITDNLLNLARIEKAEIDGKVLAGVWYCTPKDIPLVSKYAEAIGQGRDIDIKLLRTGTKTPYSTLKMYLLKAIGVMKESKRNKRILLSTLWSDLDITDRHKRKRYLENAEKMLSVWIREKHIYSYEIEADAIRIYTSGNENYTTEASLNRTLALEKRGSKKGQKGKQK